MRRLDLRLVLTPFGDRTGIPGDHPKVSGVNLERHVLKGSSHVSDPARTPPHAVRPSLHANPRRLCVGTSFFPHVDVARYDGPTFLGVQSSCDHRQHLPRHAVEDEKSVMG